MKNVRLPTERTHESNRRKERITMGYREEYRRWLEMFAND